MLNRVSENPPARIAVLWQRCVFPAGIIAVLMFALVACEPTTPIIPTQPRTLSGPTIEASPVVLPLLPTDPVDSYYGQNDPTAAALPRNNDLPPLPVGGVVQGGQVVQVTAEDGGLINGVFYQGGLVRQPGILLLAADYIAWGDFPSQLFQAGFTVLSVSLRPGEAGAADFSVLLRALSSGEADPGRLGVIGVGEGADVAFMGCAAELLCDTVVLLSPLQHDTLLANLPAFNPRAILTIASREDTLSFATAQDLASAATGDSLFQPLEGAGSGTAMLQNRPDLADFIIQWFDRQFGE
ncbi:MAG: hypothetical protein H6672_19095 [Anaerolineaceae bacterium]|nr:hypothetical protein [Anaerolineaceae bacterium]